jgi:cytochrome c
MSNEAGGLTPGTLCVAACIAVVGAAVLTLACAGTVFAADADHGKVVFQQCAACHTDKPGAIGPPLRGIVGRKSGSVDGFHYSDAMKRANLTWDEANLRDYITNPQAKVKGNRMPFGGVNNGNDIDDLMAYLEDYK